MTNPKEHRSRLRSANPIERLNGEIKRRTEVEPPYSHDTVSQSAPTHLAMPGKICHPFHQLRKEIWSMPAELMTIPEVANLLKVAEKTVYTMAQRAQLPGFKVRGQWRFKRVDLDAWIEIQKEASTRKSNEGKK